MIARLATLALAVLLAACTSTGPKEAAQQARVMRYAKVPGGRIEYEVSGPVDGEPVLFIHGAVVADTFHPIMAEPAMAGYRLINMHRRGYAGSSPYEGGTVATLDQLTADAAAVLSDLGVTRAHVVAHSAGGSPAVNLAKTHPQLVASLVLLEGGALRQPEGGPSYPPMPPGATEGINKTIVMVKAGDVDTPTKATLEGLFGADWRAQIDALGPHAYEQAREGMRTTLLHEGPWLAPSLDPTNPLPADYYATLMQPILLVWGSKGNPVTRINAQYIPQAEQHEMPGATHMMLTQEPEATAQIIADFLKRHPM